MTFQATKLSYEELKDKCIVVPPAVLAEHVWGQYLDTLRVAQAEIQARPEKRNPRTIVWEQAILNFENIQLPAKVANEGGFSYKSYTYTRLLQLVNKMSWGTNNTTKQVFPLTYDWVQTFVLDHWWDSAVHSGFLSEDTKGKHHSELHFYIGTEGRSFVV